MDRVIVGVFILLVFSISYFFIGGLFGLNRRHRWLVAITSFIVGVISTLLVRVVALEKESTFWREERNELYKELYKK